MCVEEKKGRREKCMLRVDTWLSVCVCVCVCEKKEEEKEEGGPGLSTRRSVCVGCQETQYITSRPVDSFTHVDTE